MMETEFDAAFWDDRYRSSDGEWSGDPNVNLVREASDLAPGTALEVACGEGMDAVWLAKRGWKVTATDLSAVAIERNGSIDLGDVAHPIEWLTRDILTWAPPTFSYDLVTVHFMQLASPARDAAFRKLAAAVAPRGTLLIVGHHPSDLEITDLRRPQPEYFYTAAEVAALLDPNDWEIVVEDSRERTASDRSGNPVDVHDAILRARRKPLQTRNVIAFLGATLFVTLKDGEMIRGRLYSSGASEDAEFLACPYVSHDGEWYRVLRFHADDVATITRVPTPEHTNITR